MRSIEWLSLIHISEPTRLGMISYAVLSAILDLAIFVQLRLVTDRQTDRRTDTR